MELQAQNLDLVRGTRLLQSGLGFELSAGEALWVRGPNGVGKSTLLEAICGFRRFENNQIFWQGKDVANDIDSYHSELAYCGHKNANASSLTLHEALSFYGKLFDASSSQIDAAIDAMALSPRKSIPVYLLSAGQQRRLALARLLIVRRKLWVLDEPSVSLDQDGVKDFVTHCDTHLKSGGMIIYTSHVDLGLKVRELKLTPFEKTAMRAADAFAGDEWAGVS